MRVFVTGASGFVGSCIVKDLLAAGHDVVGLVRSDRAARELEAIGAEYCIGDVNDQEKIQAQAIACDAVIHTAFNHDFTQYKASCEADRKVIVAFGDALEGSDKPLVITSGIGLLRYDRLITEDDLLAADSDTIPRAASEEAAAEVSAKGVKVYTVRLPPSVHGNGDHGFVPMIIDIAKEKGESAYIGDGGNRWPAVHVSDTAVLYRKIVELQPGQRIFHAVAEEGVAFSEIAKGIGQGLNIPAVSKTGENVAAHFGWFTHFASIDCPASSIKTRNVLEWNPKGPKLIEDILNAGYFQ